VKTLSDTAVSEFRRGPGRAEVASARPVRHARVAGAPSPGALAAETFPGRWWVTLIELSDAVQAADVKEGNPTPMRPV
jgi:hypothetical protein